jgi:hypothetical protein
MFLSFNADSGTEIINMDLVFMIEIKRVEDVYNSFEVIFTGLNHSTKYQMADYELQRLRDKLSSYSVLD